MVLFLDHKIINVSKEVCLLVVVVVRENNLVQLPKEPSVKGVVQVCLFVPVL